MLQTNVRVRQEKIVIADSRSTAAFVGPAAHRDIFAKNIFVSSNQLRTLSRKGVILRITTNDAEWMKYVGGDKSRRAAHHGMRMQYAIFAQFGVFADHGKCANLDSGTELRGFRNRSAGMDCRFAHSFVPFAFVDTKSRSTILHISVASAAS